MLQQGRVLIIKFIFLADTHNFDIASSLRVTPWENHADSVVFLTNLCGSHSNSHKPFIQLGLRWANSFIMNLSPTTASHPIGLTDLRPRGQMVTRVAIGRHSRTRCPCFMTERHNCALYSDQSVSFVCFVVQSNTLRFLFSVFSQIEKCLDLHKYPHTSTQSPSQLDWSIRPQ